MKPYQDSNQPAKSESKKRGQASVENKKNF